MGRARINERGEGGSVGKRHLTGASIEHLLGLDVCRTWSRRDKEQKGQVLMQQGEEYTCWG